MPTFLLPKNLQHDVKAAFHESRLSTARAKDAYKCGVFEGFGVKTLHADVALDHAGVPPNIYLRDLDMSVRANKITQLHRLAAYIIGVLYGTLYKCEYNILCIRSFQKALLNYPSAK